MITDSILTVIDLLTIVNIKTYDCNLRFYADHTLYIMPMINGYNKVMAVTKSKKEKVIIHFLCS